MVCLFVCLDMDELGCSVLVNLCWIFAKLKMKMLHKSCTTSWRWFFQR